MFGRKSQVTFVLAVLLCASLGRVQAAKAASQAAKRPSKPLGTPAHAQVALPAPALATYQPNELGRIPILEYHAIGGPPEFPNGPLYDSQGLNIAPDTFRRQLKLMYAAGWFPINMRDALSAHIDVPRGKIPVVLTFDDARPSQFRYRADGTLDPNCAVGILEAFHAAHPDWPRRATFYVLPESAWNGVPFDQDGLETKKLRQLARWGYEIGNHSTSHRSMANMDAKTLRWEMAACVRYLKARVPGVSIDTMALPYGIAPRNPALWDCLLHGTQGGTTYHNRCILLAVGDPAYPPTHIKFDPKQVMRVLAAPDNIEMWIQWLKPGQPLEPFVSDGNPNTVTVPQSHLNELNRSRLDGARLIVTPD
jgi:hypothetical protein